MSATVKSPDTPKKALTPNIHNAPDFKSIYVNFVQTGAGPTDISLMVGHATPTLTSVPDVEMKARLVMSPIQSKIFLVMLVQVIQQYEERYGKIAIPPVVAAQMAPAVREGMERTLG